MPFQSLLQVLNRLTGAPQPPVALHDGSILVASEIPPLALLVNKGVVWTAGETTGVSAVIAPPTTTAQISLYNNEPVGGKSYILLRAGALVTASPAGLSQVGLSYCVHRARPATTPTADILAASITNLKALTPNYNGRAIIDLAATVADDLWKPLGYSNVDAVTGVGWQVDVWADGLIILPPTGMVSFAAVAQSTSVSTRISFTWAEVLLPAS